MLTETSFSYISHFVLTFSHTLVLPPDPTPSFSLIMQASHQLRFLREWAVFGRALRRSVWELLGVAVALLLLLLAYSHAGHLVRCVLLSLFLCHWTSPSRSPSPQPPHFTTPADIKLVPCSGA